MAEPELAPVEILLSREEKVSLDESAGREGLTTAEYLRRAVLYVIGLEDQLEKLEQADAAMIVRAATQKAGAQEGADRDPLPSIEGILLRLRRLEERHLAVERRTTRLETLIELTAVGATSSGVPGSSSTGA